VTGDRVGARGSGRPKPLFREAVEKRLGPLRELWLVTHGYRSLEEQGALYAKYKAGGPKAAPPGLSPHKYGLAIEHRA
jgi:hypothetical protein